MKNPWDSLLAVYLTKSDHLLAAVLGVGSLY